MIGHKSFATWNFIPEMELGKKKTIWIAIKIIGLWALYGTKLCNKFPIDLLETTYQSKNHLDVMIN